MLIYMDIKARTHAQIANCTHARTHTTTQAGGFLPANMRGKTVEVTLTPILPCNLVLSTHPPSHLPQPSPTHPLTPPYSHTHPLTLGFRVRALTSSPHPLA